MGSRNLASISLKGYEVEVLFTELGNLLVWQCEPCSSNSLNSADENACLRCWLPFWNGKWSASLFREAVSSLKSFSKDLSGSAFLKLNFISSK